MTEKLTDEQIADIRDACEGREYVIPLPVASASSIAAEVLESRATLDAQAARIAELKAENERLREALTVLVRINEEHNASIGKIIGRPLGWKDDYLNAARAALGGNHD